MLHGVQEQGPRFDCWISVHTLKKRLVKKVGMGREGEKSVGQLFESVAISSLFLWGAIDKIWHY